MKIPDCCLLICLCSTALVCKAGNGDAGNASTEKLESLRMDILELETSIRSASDERGFLMDELEENEKHASGIVSELNRLNREIAGKVEEIRALQEQQQSRLLELDDQKQKLGRQIRAAYISGRSDYLKLLLNQEDPGHIGRALAYYDYHNRRRLDNIQATTESIAGITELEKVIRTENRQLIALKGEQERQLSGLQHSREMRRSIIENLDRYISEQGQELQRLQTQEQELKKLLTNIEESGTAGIEFFEDIAPFGTLRGNLEWPIRGDIIHHFGSPKKGANLNWQGILIEAPAGAEVKAVSTGKVVFADWFKNLGLLLIIEHGDGYMSLYGHNQSLQKKQGDWVLPGEPVALVGDSGGQSRTGLYFEIRHRGKPLNPVRWCKR
ncbi:MAG: peptidoglycan DD-metalloendopeptidase family protein [Gammaproteobacteria bacterium]|nr:peptidoglycan DD-metalloendopeptidase family protein [Gammaproteobacteria bacterium]